MENCTLSIVNLRINEETARATSQVFLNKNPSFQRTYEAWDDKLKTRLIETMLLGRAMNPIWVVYNDTNDSEEVLDGMHRLSTALSFLNNEFSLKKYFTRLDSDKYFNKKFNDLEPDDKAKIRNYNFIFNKLDSSYKKDVNKLRDMYEILNRCSRTLNDYEFNKVSLQPFYDLISNKKADFLSTGFFEKFEDSRGNVESEIIEMLVLSFEISGTWSSIRSYQDKWIQKNLGETYESISKFIEDEKNNINNKLDFMCTILKSFSNDIISNDKKIFNTYYLPYKFIISRCCFYIRNISLFNRHYKNLIEKFKEKIFDIDIQVELGCKTRNAVFQRKLIERIDSIIKDELETNKTPRLFTKKQIQDKLMEQKNTCTICNKKFNDKDDYEGDHIIPYTSGGMTIIENLQVLHKRCHQLKNG
jgi:hypothetical protein